MMDAWKFHASLSSSPSRQRPHQAAASHRLPAPLPPARSAAKEMPAVSAVSTPSDVSVVEATPVVDAAAASNALNEVMFDAARAEFERQLRAWKRLDDRVDGADECCGIRVVIARGVTPAMLEAIPYEWLIGLTFELSADGVLELVDAEGNEHRFAKTAACGPLITYADTCFQCANRLLAAVEQPGVYRGQNAQPDCVLFANFPPDGQPGDQVQLPMVVVEVEVHHRTVPESINQARLYLSEPHVLRVVLFRFFDSRVATEVTGRLHKAALAVVFERVDDDDVSAGIRVVQEVSFGTAELNDSVLKDLSEVPSRTSAGGVIRSIAPSPLETYTIRVNDMNASFPLPQHDLEVDLAPRFDASLTFGLHTLFERAARGWKQDS